MRILPIKTKWYIAFFAAVISPSTLAELYYWQGYTYGLGASMQIDREAKFPSPSALCKVVHAYLTSIPNTWVENTTPILTAENKGKCWSTGFDKSGKYQSFNYGFFSRTGNYCDPDSSSYNPVSGDCLQQKGEPDTDQSCQSTLVSPTVGNPINSASGNKFQAELDYSAHNNSPTLHLRRYYNSLDGIWKHDYSAHLSITDWAIALTNSTGREIYFTRSGSSVTPLATDNDHLIKSNNLWIYTSIKNEKLIFDESGKLVSIQTSGHPQQNLTYGTNGLINVIDNLGNTLTFTEDSDRQPLSLSAPGVQITYSYNANKRLTSVNRTTGGQTTQRHYHYEVPDKPDLLTGITDERGVRYATWAYDDQDRAISSEHANGADRVSVSYNSDGTVSVTNELGKVAKYSFQTIRGVRRITAIEGEPSPNCPSSNSTFTYDDRGLLKTKTDNNGILTTYDYNERGLEVSRTEASGTPQARTITTTWHPDWFLPVTITEPDRITQYTYDNQGRQTSQSVTQR
nr:DUF6531 domain-containing protein [Pseudomonas toyotomiensis]